MSAQLDRVLAVLDGTGQSSTETGDGYDDDGWCARCLRVEPAESGDLCAGCRAFLLGDTDKDPHRSSRDFVVTYEFEDAQATMDRLRDGLSVSGEELDRLDRLVGELAHALWLPLVAVADAFVSLYKSIAESPAIAELLALVQPTTDRAGRLIASRNDAERRLLDQRRRSHRRTNRWGSPPGRR